MCENLKHVFNMFFFIVVINENIVQIIDAKIVKIFF